MIYHGTDFNVEVVKTMTKKQFQHRCCHGNNLTPAQLSEVWDLIMNAKPSKRENSSQHGSSLKAVRRTV